MSVRKEALQPTYKRESGLWVLDFEDIKLPQDFDDKERSVVYIPPGEMGGNHKHPRTEVFLGIGELELVWIDEKGEKHSEKMNKDGELVLYEIPSMTPHAVRNISPENFGVLIEYASEEQHDVEEVKVV